MPAIVSHHIKWSQAVLFHRNIPMRSFVLVEDAFQSTLAHATLRIPAYPSSPRCFTNGSRFSVTAMGKGSISDFQTGTMPESIAIIGNVPEPSKRLPRVRGLFIRLFHLFHQLRICDLFSITDNIHTVSIAAILNIATKNNRCIFFIQFHCVTNAIHLLTSHKG